MNWTKRFLALHTIPDEAKGPLSVFSAMFWYYANFKLVQFFASKRRFASVEGSLVFLASCDIRNNFFSRKKLNCLLKRPWNDGVFGHCVTFFGKKLIWPNLQLSKGFWREKKTFSKLRESPFGLLGTLRPFPWIFHFLKKNLCFSMFQVSIKAVFESYGSPLWVFFDAVNLIVFHKSVSSYIQNTVF